MRSVGETFGRYKILRRLTHAAVPLYLCELSGEEGFARQVVAKWAGQGSTLQLDRVRVAASLTHPNLAQVIDVVRVDDGNCVVSEFVSGRSLREVQQRAAALGPAIPTAAVAQLGAQAARVLAWLHASQLTHGAVTPRNLMLGADGTLKLTDFGSSSWRRDVRPPTELARYRPPEWKPDGSAEADVFALSVVLWELLANAPFEGDVQAPSQVPRVVTQLLTRGLAREPAARPTAHEFEETLTREGRLLAVSVDDLNLGVLLDRLFARGEAADEATHVSFGSTARNLPESLAGYELGERLARLGSTDLVRAEKDGRSCVLKIQLDPQDELTHRRLLVEARNLAAISQQGVWKPNHVLEANDGRRMLRATQLSGESAARLVERQGALKPALALGLVRDLLSALAELHGAGLVGASLEPELVFLCTDPEPIHPVLIELGLLRKSTDLAPREADLAQVGRLLKVLLDGQHAPACVLHLQDWLAAPVLSYPPPTDTHPAALLAVEARAQTDRALRELE